MLDNAQILFGRYYKLDIVGVIKDSAKANKDITNVANQSVQFFNPAKGGNEVPPPKPSEKRVNKVKPVPVNFEFKVTKKLEGGQLKGGDYTFILTDLKNPDHPVQSATNDANGKVNFLPIKFNKVGTYVYQISEQVRTDSNIAYDTMSIKATVVVTENPETDNLQAAVTYNSSGGKSDGVNDTEFNNTVEPHHQRQTNHHIICLKHRVNLQLTHQATHLKNQVCHQHLNNQINRNTYQILVATTLI